MNQTESDMRICKFCDRQMDCWTHEGFCSFDCARQAHNYIPPTSEVYDHERWIVVQDDGGDDNYIAHCWFNHAVNQWEITEQTLTILKGDI